MPIRVPAICVAVALLGSVAATPVAASESDDKNSRSFAATALRGSIGLVAEPPPPPAAPEYVVATSAEPPARNPPLTVAPPVPEPSWPRTLVEVRRAKEPPKPAVWSNREIDEARQACVKQLQQIDVVALPVEPFRDGECGSPAAVQLISVGRNPEVTFSPPPVLTCEMVTGLSKWLADIQPSARRHLGAPLIRIEVMSSYSCRNAYGLRNARLSEHGRANALDISAFMTAVGFETAVQDHWGPTQRALARSQTPPTPVAQSGAQSVAQSVAKTGTPTPPAVASGPAPSVPVASPPPAFVANRPVAGPPPVAVSPVRPPDALANGMRALTGQTIMNPNGVTFAPPSRLGGPAERTRSLVVHRDASADAKSRFLKDIHVSACRIFGTVLGPEANRAHENHFHVDMAERRTGSFCE